MNRHGTQNGVDAVLTLPNVAGVIAFAGVPAAAMTAADFMNVQVVGADLKPAPTMDDSASAEQ